MDLNKASIQNLIAKGRIDGAIKLFLTTDNQAIKNELSIISGRNEATNRKERLNSASHQELGIDRANIANSLLSLCDQLDAPYVAPNTNTATITGNGNTVIQGANNSTISINSSKPEVSKQRILFIAANPTTETRVATDKEYRLIQAEMGRGRARDNFEFL
ncbi:MAG: Effector-associated domain 11, partial [Bacteroidota bacterium]